MQAYEPTAEDQAWFELERKKVGSKPAVNHTTEPVSTWQERKRLEVAGKYGLPLEAVAEEADNDPADKENAWA